MDYWKECVEEALDVVSLNATDAQIEEIASFVRSAHETYDMAIGPAPRASTTEIERLKKELEAERNKVTCERCSGRGHWWEAVGTSHSSYAECHICRGAGRV